MKLQRADELAGPTDAYVYFYSCTEHDNVTFAGWKHLHVGPVLTAADRSAAG
jgi:hypothetical protein